MFCAKCGKELQDDMKLCPYCGEKVKNKAKKGKKPILLGGVVLAVLILAMLIGMRDRKVTINLEDYLYVQFSGYEGVGKCTAQLDLGQLYSVVSEEILEKSNSEEALEYINTQLIADLRSLYITASPAEGLTTGDSVEVTLSGETTIEDYKIAFAMDTVKKEAEGFLELQEVDLADALSVEFSGIAPDVYADITVDYNKEYSFFTGLNQMYDQYIVANNGDFFEGEISYDEQTMLESGYKVINNKYSFEITGISSRDLEIESLEDEALQALAEERKALLREELCDEYSDWVLWSESQTELISAVHSVPTNNSSEYCMYLFYRTALPVRMQNRSIQQSDVYSVVCCYDILRDTDGVLTDDYYNYELLTEEPDPVDYVCMRTGYSEEELNLTIWNREDELQPLSGLEALPEITVAPETDVRENGAGYAELPYLSMYESDAAELCYGVYDSYGQKHTYGLRLDADYSGRAVYKLGGEYAAFSGELYMDTEARGGEGVDINIWGDGELLLSRYDIRKIDEAESFSIDVSGVNTLVIQSGSSDNTGGAYLVVGDGILQKASAAGKITEKCQLSDLRCIYDEGFQECDLEYFVTDNTGKMNWDCYRWNTEDSAEAVWYLEEEYTSLEAEVWVNRLVNSAETAVNLEVLADGESLFLLEDYEVYQGPVSISIDLTGRKLLQIKTWPSEGSWGGDIYLSNTILTSAAAEEAVEEDAVLEGELVNILDIPWTASWKLTVNSHTTLENRIEMRADANAGLRISTNGTVLGVSGYVCVDKNLPEGERVTLTVIGDGIPLYEKTLKGSDTDKIKFAADLTGVQKLAIFAYAQNGKETAEVILTDVMLTMAEEKVTSEIARLRDVTAVDSDGAEIDESMCVDPYGTAHDGEVRLYADESSYVIFNLNQEYTSFSGTLSAYENTEIEVPLTITLLGDGEVLEVIEDYTKFNCYVPFEVDVTGVKLLEIRAEGSYSGVAVTEDQLLK